MPIDFGFILKKKKKIRPSPISAGNGNLIIKSQF